MGTQGHRDVWRDLAFGTWDIGRHNMEHEIDSMHGSGDRRAQGLLGTGDKVGPQPPATGIFCGSSHRGSGHTDFENADYEPWNTDNTGHGNMRQRTVQNARLGGTGKGDTFHQAAR